MFNESYAENLVNSPDDLERVIEGGEEEVGVGQNESGNESGDQQNKDETDKENKIDDDKKKKITRKMGPRCVLNAQRLNGPRGVGCMAQFFCDLKLHGKGREREDLDKVMKRLEHWAHRLAPRMQFDDCLKKIEHLGSKKEVNNHLKRIRLGISFDEVPDEVLRAEQDSPPPPKEDPFDQLMLSTEIPAQPVATEISDHQREQMLRNRLIAEERRAARIKKALEMKQKFMQQPPINSQVHVSEPVEPAMEKAEKLESENTDPPGNDALQGNHVSDEEMEIDEIVALAGSESSSHPEAINTQTNFESLDKICDLELSSEVAEIIHEPDSIIANSKVVENIDVEESTVSQVTESYGNPTSNDSTATDMAFLPRHNNLNNTAVLVETSDKPRTPEENIENHI